MRCKFCFPGFSNRDVSSAESYHHLMHHLKRGMIKQNTRIPQRIQDNPDVAYYDPRNGIYF
jgi:hypothetical protein